MKANNEVGKTVSEQPVPGRQQLKIDIEVQKAGQSIYEKIVGIIKEENDLTRNDPSWIKGMLGKYAHTYTYPDGWKVSKILIPDRVPKYGAGYHKVAIVETTAGTEAGVSEAIRRAIEVKTKLEHRQSHITMETIIVLSHNIPFALANRLRVLMSTEDRTVFIYSVKNAIGVAKNALKKFANLFTIRARKIKDLPRLSEAMQVLSDTLLKRGEILFRHVTQLTKALAMMLVPKKQLRKAKDAAWQFLKRARAWGVSVWVDKEDSKDPDLVVDKVNLAAQLQGIDLFEMEQVEFRTAAERRLTQLSHG